MPKFEPTDEWAKAHGFESFEELCRLTFEADLSTGEMVTAFIKWKQEDGTKEGLLKLRVNQRSLFPPEEKKGT